MVCTQSLCTLGRQACQHLMQGPGLTPEGNESAAIVIFRGFGQIRFCKNMYKYIASKQGIAVWAKGISAISPEQDYLAIGSMLEKPDG